MPEHRERPDLRASGMTRRSLLQLSLATVPIAASFLLTTGTAAAVPLSSRTGSTADVGRRLVFQTRDDAAAERDGLVPKRFEPGPGTAGLLPGWWYNRLSVHNGDLVVTQPRMTIENLRINGRLIIRAADVLVRNCWVQGAANPSKDNQALVDCTHARCVGFVIKDSVLAPQTPTYGWNGISGHDYTACRLDIYRTVDGGRVYNGNPGMGSAPSNVVFTSCWIHGMALFAPDPNHSDNRTHNDIIQIEGGSGTKIIGCRLEGYIAKSWPRMNPGTSDPTLRSANVWAAPHPYSASGRCVTTSCIQITPNVGGVTNLQIDGNWLYGGAVGINAANRCRHSGVNGGNLGAIVNNRFDRTQGLQGGGGNNTWTVAYGQKFSVNQHGNSYMDGSPIRVRPNQTS